MGASKSSIPELSTLRTLKTRILATYQTTLRETAERIEHTETEEVELRRELEDQFIRTLLPSQDVMIPARRAYATLASVSQTFSSLAYAVESALQDRNPEPRDIYDTFFRFQEAFNEMHEVLPSYKILPDAASSFT